MMFFAICPPKSGVELRFTTFASVKDLALKEHPRMGSNNHGSQTDII